MREQIRGELNLKQTWNFKASKNNQPPENFSNLRFYKKKKFLFFFNFLGAMKDDVEKKTE